jgi:hypothetical protein
MDTRQIKTLLEKYFEGQSTLQEEQALSDYFSGETAVPELLSYRQQFVLLKALREQDPGIPDFEDRLTRMIDSQQEEKQYSMRPRSFYRLAVAASIAILIGISGYLIMNNLWRRERDTFQDSRLAYAEAQRTLLYVSQKMNQGIKPLSAVSKINSGTESLKNLKKLNTSMDMLNMVSIINNSSNLKK